MVINVKELTLSKQNEQVIQKYFETRPGWKVTKLDLGKRRAADFRICDNANCCFLCEVKTIESVRANFPSFPLDSYLEQRKTRQDEIRRWKEENPDKQLILRPDEWHFIYGDEIEFTKKYLNRRRNTEKWFKEFAQTVQDYFTTSSIKDLSYSLRIDSQDLYVPNPQERKLFFQWLEDEIKAIDNGTPSRYWQVEVQYGRAALYSTFYQIHAPTHKEDVESVYQLMVEGPYEDGSLKVNIHSYGGLNLDAITSNVESGLQQLEKSAYRKKDPKIPRIIVLAFESGIGWEWQQLSSHITWLLENHLDLSAIAVLDLKPDGVPPSPKEDLKAWIEFHAITPMVPWFVVYHSRWLQEVESLPVNIFNDKWSVQLSPI
jgi:hypothetical protein